MIINTATGEEVGEGFQVTSKKGNKATLKGIDKKNPHRVWVYYPHGVLVSFRADIFGLAIYDDKQGDDNG